MMKTEDGEELQTIKNRKKINKVTCYIASPEDTIYVRQKGKLKMDFKCLQKFLEKS